MRSIRDIFKVLLQVGLIVGLTDFLTFWVWKETFQRVRPCVFFNDLIGPFISCSQSYSFPSNHAANMMALTVVMYKMGWKHLAGVCFIASFLTSLSRIALAAHFPLDVLCGMVWGGSFAYLLMSGIEKMLYHSDGFKKLLGIKKLKTKPTRF